MSSIVDSEQSSRSRCTSPNTAVRSKADVMPAPQPGPGFTESERDFLPPWWMIPFVFTADIVGCTFLKARQCLFPVKDRIGRVVPVNGVLQESSAISARWTVSPQAAEQAQAQQVRTMGSPAGLGSQGSFSVPTACRSAMGEPGGTEKYSVTGDALSTGRATPSRSPPQLAGERTHTSSGGKRLYAGRASSRESVRSTGRQLSVQPGGSVRYGEYPPPDTSGCDSPATTAAAVQSTEVLPTPVAGLSVRGMRTGMSVDSRSGSPAPSLPTFPARSVPPTAGTSGMRAVGSYSRASVGSGIGGISTPTSASIETEDSLRRKNRRARMQGVPGEGQQGLGSSFFTGDGSAVLLGGSVVFGDV